MKICFIFFFRDLTFLVIEIEHWLGCNRSPFVQHHANSLASFYLKIMECVPGTDLIYGWVVVLVVAVQPDLIMEKSVAIAAWESQT